MLGEEERGWKGAAVPRGFRNGEDMFAVHDGKMRERRQAGLYAAARKMVEKQAFQMNVI